MMLLMGMQKLSLVMQLVMSHSNAKAITNANYVLGEATARVTCCIALCFSKFYPL